MTYGFQVGIIALDEQPAPAEYYESRAVWDWVRLLSREELSLCCPCSLRSSTQSIHFTDRQIL